MTPLDLTVSIVAYNTKELLQACLRSIYDGTSGVSFEVVVVDNCSSDGSPEMVIDTFPSTRVIVNSQNLYFSKAHNQGLRDARGRYVLFLNPDTLIPVGNLQKMVAFCDQHPEMGIASCREVDPHGRTRVTACRFPTPLIEVIERTPLRRFFPHIVSTHLMLDWTRETTRLVDVVTGCFLMSRADVLSRVGGFDERLLLYYTENDLCLRAHQLGYAVGFNGDCHYMHYQHQSARQESTTKILEITEKDMIRYYQKHFGCIQTTIMLALIKAGRLLSRIVNPPTP